MALPGTINARARALLNFLQLKSAGAQPHVLDELVRPTMELARFWLDGESKTYDFPRTGGIAANGFNAEVTTSSEVGTIVPDNEVWIVEHFGVYSDVDIGVGQQLAAKLGMALRPFSAPNVTLIPLGPGGNFVNPQRISFERFDPTSFLIVPPGAALGLWCAQVTAGPVAVRFAMRALKVRAS